MPSGSEYHESHDAEADADADADGDADEEEAEIVYTQTSRGRKLPKKSYKESESDEEKGQPEDLFDENQEVVDDEDGEEDLDRGPPRKRNTRSSRLGGFIVSDEEGQTGVGRYPTRSRSKKPPPPKKTMSGRITRPPKIIQPGPTQRAKRLTRRNTRANDDEADVYVDHPSSGADADGSLDDAVPTSSDGEGEGDEQEQDGEGDVDADAEGRPYSLRQRAKINYAIPPPIEEMSRPQKPKANGRGLGGARNGKNRGKPGWSATGAELSRWMGMAGGDDSVRRSCHLF
jgi:hypothetical protein